VGRVFLSYRYPEREDAWRLRDRLGPSWEVLTHAVKPDASETWQGECRRLIAGADAVVCIVGSGTAESPNVDWELETAIALGRPVLAMRGEGAAAPALPAPLAARGDGLLEPESLSRQLDEVALERAG
jgi:TIR domain